MQIVLAREKGVRVHVTWIRKTLKRLGYRWLPRSQKRKYGAEDMARRLKFAEGAVGLSKAQLRTKVSMAFDGVNLSNTYMLERCYDWRGLLIEAHPENFRRLRTLEPEAVNEALLARRARFEALLRAGRFWDLPHAEREAVAPEVRRVAWLPLHEACQHLLSSCQSADEPMRPVDEWQRSELERLGVSKRDPMFQTLATLLEVSRFADEDAASGRLSPQNAFHMKLN